MFLLAKGDITQFPNCINVIAHCCNCHNTFGSGLAHQIKETFPKAYEADSSAFSHSSPSELLGRFSWAEVAPRRVVFNLYGQLNYGRPPTRYLNYEALYTSLEGMAAFIKYEHFPIKPEDIRIGFPYLIGCNRAGGDWSIVYAMLMSLFSKHQTFVIVPE